MGVVATGQTVVYEDSVTVVSLPILAGQSVTSGAHEVIVYTEVAKTVLVVICGAGVVIGKTVVETGMVRVVRGQSVISGLQDEIVYTVVL